MTHYFSTQGDRGWSWPHIPAHVWLLALFWRVSNFIRECLVSPLAQRGVVVCIIFVPDAEHPRSKLGHGYSSTCRREAEGADLAGFLSGWEGRGTGWPHGATQAGASFWSRCYYRDGHHPHPASHPGLHKELCRWAARGGFIAKATPAAVCPLTAFDQRKVLAAYIQ